VRTTKLKNESRGGAADAVTATQSAPVPLNNTDVQLLGAYVAKHVCGGSTDTQRAAAQLLVEHMCSDQELLGNLNSSQMVQILAYQVQSEQPWSFEVHAAVSCSNMHVALHIFINRPIVGCRLRC
jgi:hypothetical protein